MAEAQEKVRREAEGCDAPQRAQEMPVATHVAPPSTARGWESLKAALRQLVGSDAVRTVPQIVPAA